MRHYETTFILDPVLSNDELEKIFNTHLEYLKSEGSEIVHVEKWGLRQLAYPINKRSSGIYYTIEFANESGNLIDRLEVNYRRDERIMRFLTVKLDKHAVKYNQDKRAGLIGKKKAPATSSKPQRDGEGMKD